MLFRNRKSTIGCCVILALTLSVFLVIETIVVLVRAVHSYPLYAVEAVHHVQGHQACSDPTGDCCRCCPLQRTLLDCPAETVVPGLEGCLWRGCAHWCDLWGWVGSYRHANLNHWLFPLDKTFGGRWPSSATYKTARNTWICGVVADRFGRGWVRTKPGCWSGRKRKEFLSAAVVHWSELQQ